MHCEFVMFAPSKETPYIEIPPYFPLNQASQSQHQFHLIYGLKSCTPLLLLIYYSIFGRFTTQCPLSVVGRFYCGRGNTVLDDGVLGRKQLDTLSCRWDAVLGSQTPECEGLPDARAETMPDHGCGDRSAGSGRRRQTSLAEFKLMYQGQKCLVITFACPLYFGAGSKELAGLDSRSQTVQSRHLIRMAKLYLDICYENYDFYDSTYYMHGFEYCN